MAINSGPRRPCIVRNYLGEESCRRINGKETKKQEKKKEKEEGLLSRCSSGEKKLKLVLLSVFSTRPINSSWWIFDSLISLCDKILSLGLHSFRCLHQDDFISSPLRLFASSSLNLVSTARHSSFFFFLRLLYETFLTPNLVHLRFAIFSARPNSVY